MEKKTNGEDPLPVKNQVTGMEISLLLENMEVLYKIYETSFQDTG